MPDVEDQTEEQPAASGEDDAQGSHPPPPPTSNAEPEAAPSPQQVAQQAPAPAAPEPQGTSPQPSMPQAKATPPATVLKQAPHTGFRGVLDRVLDAIAGTQGSELYTDDKGNTYVQHPNLTEGQKWARVAGTLVGGAANGWAAGRGGNPGGAAAAGFNTGMQMRQQGEAANDKNVAQARQMNEDNINHVLLNQKIAENALALKRLGVKATQEDIDHENELIKNERDLKSQYAGTYGDIGSVADVQKKHPDILKKFYATPADIQLIKHIDPDGNFAGFGVYIRQPDQADLIVPPGSQYKIAVPDDQGDRYHYEVRTTTQAMKRGDFDALTKAASATKSDQDKKIAEIQAQQATTRESNAKADAQPILNKKTEAETADAWATRDKTAAETRNLNMGLNANGTTRGSTAGGSLDPLNPADHDLIVNGLLDGTLDDQHTFTRQAAALRPRYEADAKRIDPSWTPARFAATKKAMLEFASNEPNSPGGQVTSFNYMAGHAADFIEQAERLRNGNSPIWNMTANALARGVEGNPAIAAVYIPMNNLRTEAIHFIQGSNLTETDKAEKVKMLNENMNIATMEAVAKQMLATGVIRLGGLNEGFRRTTRRDYPGLLDAQTQEVLKNAANGTDPDSKHLAYAIQHNLPKSAFTPLQGYAQAGGPPPPQPPPGATGKALSKADNKQHWVDQTGKDYGVAE